MESAGDFAAKTFDAADATKAMKRGCRTGETDQMAEGIRFACSSCGLYIETWSDGNPFYIDAKGKKKYAYHPNQSELEKCIANDEPHLCLDCGNEVNIDSRLSSKNCPKCGSANVIDTFCLEGVACTKCRKGKFVQDDSFHAIS